MIAISAQYPDRTRSVELQQILKTVKVYTAGNLIWNNKLFQHEIHEVHT